MSAANGSGDNCLRLPALFIDLDFKDLSEADARQRLEEFPLQPSIVIHSGNGLHSYWCFREPIDLTDPAEKLEAGSLLRRLAMHFGGDLACAEIARVLRVPGTKNVKYTPARLVQVERCEPELRYNPGDFDELLPAEPTRHAEPARNSGENIIREGSRNAHLTSLAGTMRRRGMTPEAIRAALQEENARRCQPPLEPREIDMARRG